MAIVFTREVNRVIVDFDSGARKVGLDPNLNVSGFTGEDNIYISTGRLDEQRSNVVLNFPVLRVSGRPNDNPPDVADWLNTNYFSGNNYGGTGPPSGDALAVHQVTQIGLEGDIDASIQQLVAKTGSSGITIAYDAKEITYLSGGITDGMINYIVYKTGGRLGTEVARRTMFYDGNANLQYTEVT